MKILIVHYRFFISGGPERYLFNVKQALENKGHQVITFSILNSRNEKSDYSDYFVDNIGLSDEIFVNKYPKTLRTYTDLIAREFYSFKVKNKLKKLINETNPDVCYLLVYKRALSPSVIDACKELGVNVVNRISDYNPVCGATSLYRDGAFCKDCFSDKDFSCLKHKCVKSSFVFSLMRYLSIKLHGSLHLNDKIDAFVCTNGFMKEMLLERKLVAEQKINIIPTFFPEKEEWVNIDKTQRLHQRVEFLFIGNVDESKGIYDLLNALSIVAKSRKDFHLNVIGGLHSDENARMLDLIDKLGIKDNVDFLPFRSDGKVFEYYLNTNVSVMPARWAENLPNTLVESLYFHRPVIVPNWGSFKYTTDDSVAFRYKVLSVDSLACTILHILENPETIEEKTINCDSFFYANYSQEEHMRKLLELFEKNSK